MGYTIDVLVDGTSIPDFPKSFKSNAPVEPSECYAASSCFNVSPSLDGQSNVFEKNPGEFTIYARDSDGNSTFGKKCEVKIGGPKDVEDKGDGSFVATYNPTELEGGEYAINVMLDGQSVEDAPCPFNVKVPGKKANPDKSYAKYVVNSDLQPTADYSLALFAVDSDGNPEVNSTCEVEMKGPDGPVNVRVEETGGGCFKVMYRPELL